MTQATLPGRRPRPILAAAASLIALAATGAPAQDEPAAASGQEDASPGVGIRLAEPEAASGEETGQNAAGASSECDALPDHTALTEALRAVVEPGNTEANGGLGNHMWAVVVDRSGVVCAVARSGETAGEQWPGSRAIAAQKAFTANGFSLPDFALSTANVFWPAQPHNGLYGLPTGNPVSTAVYEGDASAWGTADDPAVGQRLGGTVVFGGGLAFYDAQGELLGGLGLSGDESCTDHVIAWKIRHRLNLDNVPAGVSKASDDNIIHDLTTDPATGQEKSASGYGHPVCSPRAETIAENFDATHPTGPEE